MVDIFESDGVTGAALKLHAFDIEVADQLAVGVILFGNYVGGSDARFDAGRHGDTGGKGRQFTLFVGVATTGKTVIEVADSAASLAGLQT